jgi:hypothetical protein
MVKSIRNGLVILSVLLPLITQAQPCSSVKGSKSLVNCDVTFTAIPTFTDMCASGFQTGTYTIKNNTPANIILNYIRIKGSDSQPAGAATIDPGVSNNCGGSLGAGATCNIKVNLQPTVAGQLNQTLQIGIDTRQVELDATAIASIVNICPPPPPGPNPTPSTFGAAILGASTITNSGLTLVSGDVDLTPGSSITGFPPGVIVPGTGAQHINDAVATAQKQTAQNLFNANIPPGAGCPGGTNLSGQDLGTVGPLTAGIYCFNTSAQLTGVLTLNGPGTFIFKIGSTLTTATSAAVVGTATNPSNIIWIVGTSATLGTSTTFRGIIDANTSITINGGAGSLLSGNAWALNGAVTISNPTVINATPNP